MAAIAILPALAIISGVSGNFAKFFGGTTILIMIGVVLDTLQQIESYLLNRHYDGLMKTGRIKGRERSGAMIIINNYGKGKAYHKNRRGNRDNA